MSLSEKLFVNLKGMFFITYIEKKAALPIDTYVKISMSVFAFTSPFIRRKPVITSTIYFHILLNNCAITNCFFSRTTLYKNIISDVLKVINNNSQIAISIFKNMFEKTRLNNKLNRKPTPKVSLNNFLSVSISCLFETSESLKNTCSKPRKPKEIHTCIKVINMEYSPYWKSLRVAFKTIFTKKILPAPASSVLFCYA